MGQCCRKKLKDQNSQVNVRPPTKGMPSIFLDPPILHKVRRELDSERPGPSGLAPKKQGKKGRKSAKVSPKEEQPRAVQINETPASFHNVDAQAVSQIMRPLGSANQPVWLSSVSSAENIPAASKIFIVRKTNLPGDKVKSLIDNVPAPKKIYIIGKASQSSAVASHALTFKEVDRQKKLPQESRNSSTKELCESSQKPTPESAQSTLPEQTVRQASPLQGKSQHQALTRRHGPKMAGRTTYIKQMQAQMESKDFQERIVAIGKLKDDCDICPDLVKSCIFPVFDAVRARLTESNRNVNLHMLEALASMIPQLKESLPKVVFILVPGIVDIHLNSKNAAIYSAALVAMHALIQNLDNALLLDIFVAKAQVLAGQAKADVTETVADIVMELYPHKPKMVEQEVLPLLWHLLVQSSHREATATLCRALYIHMGPKLRVCAASQPVSIVRSLDHLLNTVVES